MKRTQRHKYERARYSAAFAIAMTIFALGHSLAQKDRLWYFGNRAGLDFATGTPLPVLDNTINTYEGVSAVCDASGQLKYYTEGLSVKSGNHVTMPNGLGLLGGKSSTHSALSVADPGHPGRYYLFTADECVGEGIHYSLIDMTANGGSGDVMVKNVRLLELACEKLAAVYHANGQDIWLVGHQWQSNAFYAWKVGPSGISNPVVSHTGTHVTGQSPFIETAGQLKFSPDGTRLVSVNTGINTQLFDFDAATGMVSNPVTLLSGYEFGAEFAPSSQVLYVTEASQQNLQLYQFDLNAPDIPASAVAIAVGQSLSWGMLQLGPDAKIYVASYGNTQLSVIERPDVLGMGCTLSSLSVSLGGRTNYYGLPTFFQPGFYVTAINNDGSCSGNPVSFDAVMTREPDTVLWDFGDGNTSSAWQPQHQYAQPGLYSVKLKATWRGFERYFATTVAIVGAPVAHQPGDLTICTVAAAGEFVDLSQQDAVILGNQSGLGYVVTYHASVEEASAGTNALPSMYLAASDGQTIFARVSAPNGCYGVTSFTLHLVGLPPVDLPGQYTICDAVPVQIVAPAGYGAYLWSTGQATRVITVSTPGEYSLTVTGMGTASGCTSTVTVTVSAAATPIIQSVSIHDGSPGQNSVAVVAAPDGDYLYSLDGITFQSEPLFTALPAGQYTIYVKSPYGCGLASQNIWLLDFPRFFTPNGDGFNDTWEVKGHESLTDMVITIFDRYGAVLGRLTHTHPAWSGEMAERPLPSSDYWFEARRQGQSPYRSHFTLKR